MEHDYRIQALAGVFSDHADMAEASNQYSVACHKQNYPDQELPEQIMNPFNVAKALSVMAAEIAELKTRCG